MSENSSNNQDNSHKEHLYKVIYFSFLGGVLLMVLMIASIYTTDMSLLQGYFKSIKTTDTANLELQFEHLLVIDTVGSTVSMDVYVKNLDNLGSEKIEGVDLIFDNFPSYLSLESFEKPTGWNAFESLADIATGFDSSNPRLGLFGDNLVDGKVLTLNFKVVSGVPVIPEIVKISAVFSNSLNNYTTEEGQFLVRPSSEFTFSLPNSIASSSIVTIPIKIAGVSASKPIYGFSISMENVPSYMVLDTNGVMGGSSISSWSLSNNSVGTSDAGYGEDVIIAVGLNMAQSSPFVSATDDLLTFVFTIDTSKTINIPEDPIVVNGYVTDAAGEHYMLPGIIPFAESAIQPQASDICAYNKDGNVTSTEKDSLVAIADLHCLVTEWDNVGEDLAADIYTKDNLNKVNIKDLTVLLSQWSREPEIESITPQSGPITSDFVLTGQYFYPGHPVGVVKAYLKDKSDPDQIIELNILEHTETSIKLNIPTSVPTGDYYVRMTVGDELVSTVSGFEVTTN